MFFKGVNMVDYYTKAYESSHQAVLDAIAEPNQDLKKIKALVRRCRNDKAAMDLNIGLANRK